MDEIIQNEVRAVIGMIHGTKKANNRYRHLSKSQENITGMPYIKHFYPINYAYSDLITFSFKAKTQYSPNKHPQKPNKSADQ
jgi:predicted nucleotidyltransferase